MLQAKTLSKLEIRWAEPSKGQQRHQIKKLNTWVPRKQKLQELVVIFIKTKKKLNKRYEMCQITKPPRQGAGASPLIESTC